MKNLVIGFKSGKVLYLKIEQKDQNDRGYEVTRLSGQVIMLRFRSLEGHEVYANSTEVEFIHTSDPVAEVPLESTDLRPAAEQN